MPFVNREIFDRIGIKYREKSEQVRRIVNRRFVKQDQILIGTPAAHKKTSAYVVGLDSWKELYGFDYIALTKCQGHHFKFPYIQLNDPDVCGYDIRIEAIAGEH